MSKPKYIVNPYPLYITCFASTIFMIFFLLKEIYSSQVADLIFLIILVVILIIIDLLLFILRKTLFLKMIINEKGITKYYKNSITCALKWEDFKDAEASFCKSGICIHLSNNLILKRKKTIKEYIEDFNKNSVYIKSNSEFFNFLCKYKNNISIEIKNLENMPQYFKEKLKK